MDNEMILKVFYEEIKDYPILTKEEVKWLYKKIANGDKEAHDYLVKCNLKLVLHIARKFENKGVELLDLVQEGYFALERVIDNFNPDLNIAFSSYAQKALIRTMDKVVHDATGYKDYNRKLRKYKKAFNEFYAEFYREPTPHEMADILDTDVSEINKLRCLECGVMSLETEVNIGTGDVTNYKTLLKDDEASELQNNAIYFEVEEAIKKAFQEINWKEREEEVLYEIFFNESTLNEVGAKLNVSRERVRQLKLGAISKLGKHEDIKNLCVYFADPYEARKNLEKMLLSRYNLYHPYDDETYERQAEAILKRNKIREKYY